MKNKKWITLATAVVLAVTALPLGVFAAKKDEAKLAKVTLNEVAHSIFYAPQYVAIEEGYFKSRYLNSNIGFFALRPLSRQYLFFNSSYIKEKSTNSLIFLRI